MHNVTTRIMWWWQRVTIIQSQNTFVQSRVLPSKFPQQCLAHGNITTAEAFATIITVTTETTITATIMIMIMAAICMDNISLLQLEAQKAMFDHMCNFSAKAQTWQQFSAKQLFEC